ncbi:MAG TPA: rhomboid family intramembrane serine protease [Chitinophaga sp.]|uniref:rhomboid family intramembrane serine protease n=1 Tax=Chitinophaga sp. TaxID=1869181 RepID=UPI002CC0F433|nr:rhomboid family intramembrane serine protease [Chitinophaga sp.]HVI49452.1 rhomboid family intramembrane serine protease [Chitinophaga sp.]
MDIIARLRRMPFTLLLITLNVIIFFLLLLTGMDIWQDDGELLVQCGANYWPLTMHGQYWRLFASMFLHAGLWHLLTNMAGLFIAGMFLEPVLRIIRLAIAYTFTGLIANYASIYVHKGVVGVGASGAIFGLYGVFLALLTTTLFRPAARKAFLVYIGLFTVLSFAVAFFSVGIDNVAHLAGYISGLFFGYLLYFTLSKADGERLPG